MAATSSPPPATGSPGSASAKIANIAPFVRVAAAVPPTKVALPAYNAEQTISLWRQADAASVQIVVFPELGLSAYTARDLFQSQPLLTSCLDAVGELLTASRTLGTLAWIGLPLRVGPAIYNIALAIQRGQILAAVPKTYLPTYGEFEERRWFTSGSRVARGETIELLDQLVPFGTDILLVSRTLPDLVVGAEICEDLWVPLPPSTYQTLAGATVICNLSASNVTIGKAQLRRLLASATSDRGKCAYIYVAAGPGESSTDWSFDGDSFICENGRELAATQRFERNPQLVSADIDLHALVHERLRTGTFSDCSLENNTYFRRIPFDALATSDISRSIDPHPFVPKQREMLDQRCSEIFEIQRHALATRLQAAGIERLVLGVSGGLDSTHAALVAAAALDALALPRTHLHCVTIPGLATSPRTLRNATTLASALGSTAETIEVSEATHVILQQLGHPAVAGCTSAADLLSRLEVVPTLTDVAFENAQARLRTLLLMTRANMVRGLVVGTGDLSEKALGWSTYAGDQIAMYDVNAGVPKTLIRCLISWVAQSALSTFCDDASRPSLEETLRDTLATPISPELIPTQGGESSPQATEHVIGPFELHDFYLYHLVRHGRAPAQILELAQKAFGARYKLATHKKWLRVFLFRFFSQQFKRSCTADGPKVGMVALSPRGDWRMPSDAQVQLWIDQLAD